MAKHLKIRAVLSRDHKSVTMYLKEQTHFSKEFGIVIEDYKEYGPFGFEHFKVMIYSHGGAFSIWHFGDRIMISVPATATDDEKQLTVPPEEWTRIKGAVEAYNKFFEDK